MEPKGARIKRNQEHLRKKNGAKSEEAAFYYAFFWKEMFKFGLKGFEIIDKQ